MIKNIIIKSLCLTLSLMVLQGCNGKSVNTMLGLDRRGPDEFTVLSHPTPVIPEDCDHLPMPIDSAH